MKISYSFGMVDFLHFGHMRSIKKAAADADLMVFGVVSDEASDAWFGSHVSNVEERSEVIAGIKYIDRIILQKTFDPLDNLRLLHDEFPDAIITLYHGNEWGLISAKRYIEAIGGKVVKLDYYEKMSPQRIIETLNVRVSSSYRPSSNLISTKANTLQFLKPSLQNGYIEDILIITIGEMKNKRDTTIQKVVSFFVSGKIIVRSSSKREDAFEESNAGHFESILNVDASDLLQIGNAIDTVIKSYGSEIDDDEQVLIQRQTTDVKFSGVIFTKDIKRNRPYYVINYDNGGSTESVTSGMSGSTLWIHRDIEIDKITKPWNRLMNAVKEIEDIFHGVLLDIEFAITSSKVVIFQVRPLAAAYKIGLIDESERINEGICIAKEKYSKLRSQGLSRFSDMAFWNPAEIIGENPKSLDYSLYKYIITKSAWEDGIYPLGYRHVDGDLMYRFGNKPYISIEKSFEALTPVVLPDSMAQKLSDFYCNYFATNSIRGKTSE